MKKKSIILTLFFALLSCVSCNFLEVDPELGLTEEDVFSTYKNYRLYFDYVMHKDPSVNKYNIHEGYPLYVDFNDRRFTLVATTDAADAGRLLRAQQEVKIGKLSQETCNDFTFTTSSSNRRPIALAMFRIIRIANRSIENIDKLTNAKPQEVADLLGQAYFVRGYAHFVLCRFFGGMPYINESQKDDWDLPRLSANETYRLAAEDFYRAYEYLKEAGKMRRDARPGVAGHLAAADMNRPSGCAALAIRARALMYAASPLNNLNGQQDWIEAADAYALALNTALEWDYALLPAAEYTDNFFGKESTNESLWSFAHTVKGNNTSLTGYYAYPQSNYSTASGTCPTQNFVDKYETADGYPLNTEADRAAAKAAGSYQEQRPFENRDPRFELTILHDGSTTPYLKQGEVINIHYDPETGKYPTTSISGKTSSFGIAWGSQDGTKGYSNTGYYLRKQWRGARSDQDVKYVHHEAIVRLAEVYLSYAECVNEAYGPNGRAGNAPVTALEAVNIVRNRIGMPDVRPELCSGQDVFRERIRNERNVELAFEGNNYYFDIRRWKVAPQSMGQPLYGMYVEKCPVSDQYPLGRKYERRQIPQNRQCVWKDYMYWWPFPDEQADKLVNFKNNEKWQ